MNEDPNPALLGVCYYPEHWPESTWAEDAARMKDLGLHWVRIGEFAWSLLEPEPGRYAWGWMDRAIDGLGAAGLQVVLGTPTATPPKWLVDRMPDMLPVGADGRVRGFGSRRHYDFAHEGYRTESARIAAALAERYGRHDAVGAWQIDNEYGCHDTVRAYGAPSLHAFRSWLRARYGTVDALNEAWWTNFWSMTYRSFDEVELPVGAVTEAAPGARLDFARFASDAVVAYHERQVAEIRPRSPGRPITHNGMGFFADYDAHALGRALDRITWDSYPLGMLEQSPLPVDLKARYARTGHPDLVAFNHDVFRGALAPAGDAPYVPFWVMEQQPGQVNWATTNPIPAPGAVRLWTHQALAHGAEVVSYFRWRAALGAQEHMHAGLLRHDRTPDQAFSEAEACARELSIAGTAPSTGAPVRRRGHVALLFDYADLWLGQIQPHAEGWRDWAPWAEPYFALRALGLDVDVLPPDRDLTGYRLVVAPSLTIVDDARAAALQRSLDAGATLVVGPRSGAYRTDARVHAPAPGPLLALTGARVRRVDTMRPGTTGRLSPREPMLGLLEPAGYGTWADLLEPEASTEVWASYAEATYGGVAAIAMKRHGDGRCVTVGAALDGPTWGRLLGSLALEAGLPVFPLPDGVRLSRHAGRPLLQNFGAEPVTVDLRPIGGPVVEVGGVDVAWVDLPEAPPADPPRPAAAQGVRS
jgi:beta-galactosidase